MLIEDCYCAFVWSTDTIFFENRGLARTLTRWEYLRIATELNSSAPFWLELKYTTQRCFHVHVLRTPQVTKPVCFWLIRLKRYCHAPHHTLLWNQPQYPTCPMSIAHQAMPSSGLWPPRPQVGLKQDISLYTCVCLYDSSTDISITATPPECLLLPKLETYVLTSAHRALPVTAAGTVSQPFTILHLETFSSLCYFCYHHHGFQYPRLVLCWLTPPQPLSLA